MRESPGRSRLRAIPAPVSVLLVVGMFLSTMGSNCSPTGLTTKKQIASVELDAPADSIQVGGNETIQLLVTDNAGDQVDNLGHVTWTSSDPSIATVDSAGVVTGVAPGTDSITATVGGVSGSTSVKVVAQNSNVAASIQITPGYNEFFVGEQEQYSASVLDSAHNVLGGKTVTWTADPDTAFTVTADGLVKMVAKGNGYLKAEADGVVAQKHLWVMGVPVRAELYPDTATIAPGYTLSLGMRVYDSSDSVRDVDVSKATWYSDSTQVATVDDHGQVSALREGVAHIMGKYLGSTAWATITVRDSVASVTVSPDSASLSVGDTLRLTATAKDTAGIVVPGRPVSWLSSDSSIATVDSTGLVTGTGSGTATVVANIAGQSGWSEVVVTAPTPSHTVDINAVDFFTRKLMADSTVQTFDSVLVAGDHEKTGDHYLQGFVVFPLDSLKNVTSVSSAKLAVHFDTANFEGNPFSLGGLYVEQANDSASLNEGALSTNAIEVATSATDTTVNIAPLVQAAIVAGKSDLILNFRFEKLQNNNGAIDYAMFDVGALEVKEAP